MKMLPEPGSEEALLIAVYLIFGERPKKAVNPDFSYYVTFDQTKLTHRQTSVLHGLLNMVSKHV